MSLSEGDDVLVGSVCSTEWESLGRGAYHRFERHERIYLDDYISHELIYDTRYICVCTPFYVNDTMEP